MLVLLLFYDVSYNDNLEMVVVVVVVVVWTYLANQI